MKIRVQYTAQLRTALGRSAEDVELPEGSSLATLFGHLAAKHPDDARMHFVAAGGEVLRSLMVVVNGSATAAKDAAATLLRAGDEIVLLPPIAGG